MRGSEEESTGMTGELLSTLGEGEPVVFALATTSVEVADEAELRMTPMGSTTPDEECVAAKPSETADASADTRGEATSAFGGATELEDIIDASEPSLPRLAFSSGMPEAGGEDVVASTRVGPVPGTRPEDESSMNKEDAATETRATGADEDCNVPAFKASSTDPPPQAPSKQDIIKAELSIARCGQEAKELGPFIMRLSAADRHPKVQRWKKRPTLSIVTAAYVLSMTNAQADGGDP
jgi:hypothetical protein